MQGSWESVVVVFLFGQDEFGVRDTNGLGNQWGRLCVGDDRETFGEGSREIKCFAAELRFIQREDAAFGGFYHFSLSGHD